MSLGSHNIARACPWRWLCGAATQVLHCHISPALQCHTAVVDTWFELEDEPSLFGTVPAPGQPSHSPGRSGGEGGGSGGGSGYGMSAKQRGMTQVSVASSAWDCCGVCCACCACCCSSRWYQCVCVCGGGRGGQACPLPCLALCPEPPAYQRPWLNAGLLHTHPAHACCTQQPVLPVFLLVNLPPPTHTHLQSPA